MANLTNMRKHIFPSLMEAYKEWENSNDLSALHELAEKSRTHWLDLSQQILALFNQYGDNSHEHIEQLVNNNTL
jgi:hypothetical protein